MSDSEDNINNVPDGQMENGHFPIELSQQYRGRSQGKPIEYSDSK